MGPWILLAVVVALINLLVFLAVRGRWGRIVPVLGLAALIGAVLGNVIGARTGLELLRIGDFHVVGASVMAQLLMIAVSLLSAMGPVEVRD